MFCVLNVVCVINCMCVFYYGSVLLDMNPVITYPYPVNDVDQHRACIVRCNTYLIITHSHEASINVYLTPVVLIE